MYSSNLYHTHRSNSRPYRHFRYYVNTQENPPRSSWEHPHGPAPPSGPPPSHYAPPSGRPPATGDRGFNQSSGGYNPSYGDGYGGPPQQQGGYNHPQGYGGPDYQQSQQGFDSGPPPAQGSRGEFFAFGMRGASHIRST